MVRRRWSVILPAVGLLAFSVISYYSFRWDQEVRGHAARHFYWSFIRLDTDPLGRHTIPASNVVPCQDGSQDCVEFDPEIRRVDPGYLELALETTAFPAFVVSFLIVVGLGKLGVDQVWSFMVTAPLFIPAWFYLMGWLVDRWRSKRRMRSQRTTS